MMNIESILTEFRQNRGYFPKEAVREAIQQKEEITPYLLRSLEEIVQQSPHMESEESSFLPLYAMFLLAQFRERRAYSVIMDLCKLPHKTLDNLLGDIITEGLPNIIASVFDGSIVPIQSVIENATIDEFTRGSALRSLSILVYAGVLARVEVICYLTELFRGKLEKKYSHIWDALASEAVDLHATALAEDIRTAYEEGLLARGYMNPGEAERILAMSEETVLAQSKKHSRGLIDDAVKEMHWWACFRSVDASQYNQKKEHDLSEDSYNPGTITQQQAKIGRNHPCPCGSRKKVRVRPTHSGLFYPCT
jgi:hypothetical protein